MANYIITLDTIIRSIKSFERQCRNPKNKPTDYTLYLGISDEDSSIVKFGITNGRLGQRKQAKKLRSIHAVYKSDKFHRVAWLEAIIKMSIDTHIEAFSFDKLRYVIMIIRNYRYLGDEHIPK